MGVAPLDVVSVQVGKIVGSQVLTGTVVPQHIVRAHQEAVGDCKNRPILSPTTSQAEELRSQVGIVGMHNGL